MKLTKYQHACFVVEKDNQSLVVDPGTFSHDFIMPKRVAGIVISHEHPDHFDEHLVEKILAKHPEATLIAHESVSGRFTNYKAVAATPNQTYTIGAFSLQFFGGEHAAIAPSISAPPNLGILIDDSLYYPGDSFVIPEGVNAQTLALPVSAPWLKIHETMDFLQAMRPAFVFPTHDGILSEDGKHLVDRMLGTVAGGQHTTYKRLDGLRVEL